MGESGPLEQRAPSKQKRSGRQHCTDLSVAVGEEGGAHEAVDLAVARGAVHDVGLALLPGEGNGGGHLREKVDTEGGQGERKGLYGVVMVVGGEEREGKGRDIFLT